MRQVIDTIAERILEASGGRRPAIGSIRCPWCQSGDLYFTVHRDGRFTINCTTELCADLRNVESERFPSVPQGDWLARSQPPEASS